MDLQESVDKISRDGTQLTDSFYKLFFERHPEIKQYFEGTDMLVQSVMLMMTLTAVKQHPDIPNASRIYLRLLGTKHKRKGIPKDLYAKFLETLLVALEDYHGDEWDEGLSTQWKKAIEDTQALMLDGYAHRFHA